mmetsp:Transcript_26894/g.25954  ORF Transcript_26894/g.25954 Transcript_26894/m.25954 type:complete len:83 (+) Transcript_26894:166-414(+)
MPKAAHNRNAERKKWIDIDVGKSYSSDPSQKYLPSRKFVAGYNSQKRLTQPRSGFNKMIVNAGVKSSQKRNQQNGRNMMPKP